MIICACGFSSSDASKFSVSLVPAPRGLVTSRSLTPQERAIMLQMASFFSLKCPACGCVYTTRPTDPTVIRLQKGTEHGNNSET